MRFQSAAAAGAIALVALGATACSAEPEADPVAVTDSVTITNIQDDTRSEFYTVTSATLTSTGIGLELTLGFDITNTNGQRFSPVSTITFQDGTTIVCEADDLRRRPSLVETTDTWDFACDASAIPEESDDASVTVVDNYS